MEPFSLFATFASAVTGRHDRALTELGVPAAWLHAGPARYGVASAVFADDHWEPHEDGTPVCVLPDAPLSAVGDVVEPVADLIAFRTADPGRWWLLTGAAVLLNPTARDRADYVGDPLVIHRAPLDWMRAGGDGVVVLDWGVFLPLHLGGVPLFAADLPLGERLDRALNRSSAPTPISVLRGAAA